MKFLDNIPLATLVIISLTLGLAPFTPPHVWTKLQMLFSGALVEPIDIFDLLMHGLPWLALFAKLGRMAVVKPDA
ncbi:RND transporter [Aliiroseovarius subalbicans]|uniref:RND transporter n=1 Tax=Aliiroseovarius subalbicans TaxID=2925840 RepID=UPI001F57D946|nr:RND transporter [Aliiroseovarius subalbicans]MCI2398709.1 RND transporter [Aliiroseovarius subalbicans]